MHTDPRSRFGFSLPAFHGELLFAALLAVSVTASARPPIMTELGFETDNEVLAPCGAFDIISNGTGTIKVTTYFGPSGQPDRVDLHGMYSGTLTNSMTGKSLVNSPAVANISSNLVAGTERQVGTFFNVTMPHVGNVLFNTGRIKYDGKGTPAFETGQQHAPPETVAILCAALQ
ncbi:MAG: hypothetical protein ABJB04_03835 [Betaproteobacteria bacterium]